MKKDWTYKKLGEVCDVLNGYAFKSDKYVDKGIRVIRIANVQKGVIVDDQPAFYPLATQSEIDRYLLNEGDILMSLTGNVGRVGILQKEMLPAALNQRVTCLRMINNALHSRFFFHYLNSDLFEQKCIASARGIAQLNMSTEWLKEQFIPIPPLSIQRSIVSELDLLHSVIEKKQEQLRALDNLAQSLFYQMFGDPITNPMGWQVKKLGEVASLLNGRAYQQKELLDQGKYRVLRVGNFFTNNTWYYSDLELPEDKYCDKGDLLFTWSASFGAHIWNGDKVIYHYHIWKIVLDEMYVDKLFYLHLLNNMVKSMMHDTHGTGMLHLTKSGMEMYDIPLPPLSLQQSFAAKVSAIEEQKRFISQSIKDVESLLAQRMDHYFG